MKDYGLSFLAIEFIWFFLLVVIQRKVQKDSDGAPYDMFDDGPLWSVAFHRAWLVCHLPAMAVHVVINALGKFFRLPREIGLPLPAFHLVNYAAMLTLINI